MKLKLFLIFGLTKHLPVNETRFADGAVTEEDDFGEAQRLHLRGAASRPDLSAEIGLRRVQTGVVSVRHREAENLAVALGVLLHDAARRRAHNVGPTQVQRLRVHFDRRPTREKIYTFVSGNCSGHSATSFLKLRLVRGCAPAACKER